MNRTKKSRIGRWVLPPLYFARDLKQRAVAGTRLSIRRHWESGTRFGIRRYGKPAKHWRLLVVVTHVVTESDLSDQEGLQDRMDSLAQVLDCVRSSFFHHEIRVILNTYRNLNLIERLPSYHREFCEIVEHIDGDPMLVEFAAQDLFLGRKDMFDWFLFLEDDLLVTDTCFLEKLDEFNQRSGQAAGLLLPHRFELNDGKKFYIDRDFGNRGWVGPEGSEIEDIINEPTTISYESGLIGRQLQFAEFSNPHAACYCLNREQLELWERSGRKLFNQVCWIGPLESAATGCLFECFDLYKPHPENKWYMEVRHMGRKYSNLFQSNEAASAIR